VVVIAIYPNTAFGDLAFHTTGRFYWCLSHSFYYFTDCYLRYILSKDTRNKRFKRNPK